MAREHYGSIHTRTSDEDSAYSVAEERPVPADHLTIPETRERTERRSNSPDNKIKPAEGLSVHGPKPKPARFLRHVTLTVSAEVITLASRVVIVSIIGRRLGAGALAQYLLLTRVVAWFLAGTLLGLGVGLPRYVARTAGDQKQGHAHYFQAASICLMLASISLGLILIAYRQTFAYWLFGNSQLTGLVLALAVMLWGLTAQATVYGYYQGLLAMGRAGLLEVSTIALAPLVAVIGFYWTRSISFMMGAAGCLDILVSGLFAIPIFRQVKVPTPSVLVDHIRELLKYGIPRLPGDFVGAALTALGPVIAAHYLTMAQISAFLLGQTMLIVTGYATGPLDVVLLSKVSMMLGRGQLDAVRARLEHLIGAVLEVSIFACIQLVIFADVAVRVWVGTKCHEEMHVIRLLLLAIPPYLFYMALRSSIDAVTVKALNARNLLVAMTVYVLLIETSVRLLPAKFLLLGFAGSLVVAVFILGVRTLLSVGRLYGLRVPWARSSPALVAALILGVAAYISRGVLNLATHPAQVALLELGLGSAYMALLTVLGSGWLNFAWKIAFGGRKGWTLGGSNLTSCTRGEC